VDDFWADPDRTRVWFAGFGLDNIQHHRVTTQEFAVSEHFVSMSGVDLLFVDGYHTAEQARFDHEAFEPLLTKNAIVLFHDSVRWKQSHIYGQDRPYEHTVLYYMDELKKRPNLQVMDIPLDSGVTIVRRIG
jgi:predicted O-methyltransferase YrrM